MLYVLSKGKRDAQLGSSNDHLKNYLEQIATDKLEHTRKTEYAKKNGLNPPQPFKPSAVSQAMRQLAEEQGHKFDSDGNLIDPADQQAHASPAGASNTDIDDDEDDDEEIDPSTANPKDFWLTGSRARQALQGGGKKNAPIGATPPAGAVTQRISESSMDILRRFDIQRKPLGFFDRIKQAFSAGQQGLESSDLPQYKLQATPRGANNEIPYHSISSVPPDKLEDMRQFDAEMNPLSLRDRITNSLKPVEDRRPDYHPSFIPRPLPPGQPTTEGAGINLPSQAVKPPESPPVASSATSPGSLEATYQRLRENNPGTNAATAQPPSQPYTNTLDMRRQGSRLASLQRIKEEEPEQFAGIVERARNNPSEYSPTEYAVMGISHGGTPVPQQPVKPKLVLRPTNTATPAVIHKYDGQSPQDYFDNIKKTNEPLYRMTRAAAEANPDHYAPEEHSALGTSHAPAVSTPPSPPAPAANRPEMDNGGRPDSNLNWRMYNVSRANPGLFKQMQDEAEANPTAYSNTHHIALKTSHAVMPNKPAVAPIPTDTVKPVPTDTVKPVPTESIKPARTAQMPPPTAAADTTSPVGEPAQGASVNPPLARRPRTWGMSERARQVKNHSMIAATVNPSFRAMGGRQQAGGIRGIRFGAPKLGRAPRFSGRKPKL